jgi:RNA-binding protein NOB1
MVLSYSAIAQPAADTPKTISIATPAPEVPAAEVASPVSPSISTRPAPLPSQPISGPSSDPEAGPSRPTISHLILDAGPLLSLTPLRHLATTFHTTPLVLAELRDPKAREHWERLSLSGVDVRVEQPKTEAMAKGQLGG